MRDKANINNIQSTDVNAKAVLSVTLDHALYERYLVESNLTQAQKKEFLETLWNIIVSFVDLGFEVHPAQHAETAASQDGNRDSQRGDNLLDQSDAANQVKSKSVEKARAS